MIPQIDDATLEQAERELKVQQQIIGILKKLDDPVKRARVMRAVAVLYGLDESPQ